MINDRRQFGSLCAAALEYAERGYPIFPVHHLVNGECSCNDAECTSFAKHPRTPHGFYDATIDLDKVEDWWTTWPNANIGIPTGRHIGWVVLDVDGDDGPQSLARFEQLHGELPLTALSRTDSGGLHYIFAHPEICDVPNSQGRIAPRLDVRGDGGYIVAPPSVNADGPYKWLRHPEAVELADVPVWLLERMLNPCAEARTGG